MTNTKIQQFIKDNYVNVSALARSMGVTRQSLNAKISGKVNFTQLDLELLRRCLRLTDEQFMEIFFAREDEKQSTGEVVAT